MGPCLTMFRHCGYDTQTIAEKLLITEAEAYNRLASEREINRRTRERADRRRREADALDAECMALEVAE